MQVTVTLDTREAIRTAASMTYDYAADAARARVELAKSRIVASRVGRVGKTRIGKINDFVSKPKVVKIATTALGIETVVGFFGCVATSSMMFASGNIPFGVGVIMMYLFGLCVRYIMAHAALTHEGV